MLEGLRILVAEDDLLLAEVVVTALDKAGCVVMGPAPRLAKTIELAERSELDVALLDINLNGETCYPAAWLLLERKVPFAFMTAYSPSYIPKSLGFIAVLAKPFDEGELLAMVERLARRDVAAALADVWSPGGQLPSDPGLPRSG
jgi:DNA-binding response OmpR family regulator